MGKINILVNNKNYTFMCNDGEEDKIQSAASIFNSKLDKLKASNPHSSLDLLMIITIIEIQNQLSELETLQKLSMNMHKDEGNNLFEQISFGISKIKQLTQKLQNDKS